MSLGVVIKGPEGVVLAVDSRVTLEARKEQGPPLPINFDNATKLFSFSKPHNYVGIVTYGLAAIGLRTAHSFIPEFEISFEKNDQLNIEDYAERLSSFFLNKWKEGMPKNYNGPPMFFIVGGYDPGDAYGKVFLIDIPNNPKPSPRNAGENEFGMTWGGQLEIGSRIIHGYDPLLPVILQKELGLTNEQISNLLELLNRNLEYRIPYQVLPLQDCVNLATFMVETTIGAQSFSVGIRGVGGPIDVAVISRTKGLEYIREKIIHIQ